MPLISRLHHQWLYKRYYGQRNVFDNTCIAVSAVDKYLPGSRGAADFCSQCNGYQWCNRDGSYSGPGTSPAGMFDPNIAGPGTHTITYTFNSASGCTGTITSTIEVYPRPTAIFTVSGNNGACLGQAVTLTNSSTFHQVPSVPGTGILGMVTQLHIIMATHSV